MNQKIWREELKKAYRKEFKAKKVLDGRGYVVKRKARLNHVCEFCGNIIRVNEEYFQLNYYGSYVKKPICKICWFGKEMCAKNLAKYKGTDRFATEGKGGLFE